MALSTTKKFHTRAMEQAAFYNETGEPRVNIEGTVSIAEESLVSNVNVDSTSASYGGTYIGKVSTANGGDFDVAYTSAETMTFSNYPAGITGLHADDVELVRQINTSGAVVESYSRDDATMSIAGDVLTVTGAAFGATDTFVVLTNISSGDASAEVTVSSGVTDGGNNVYCNISSDFTATIVNASKTITIAGLPFTPTAANFAAGSIKKIAVTTGVVTGVDMTDVVYAGGVLSVNNEGTNFATGDVVIVNMIGPDKAYDIALDSGLSTVLNPEYAHYTSVETLVNESDLGITGTAAAGSNQTTLVAATAIMLPSSVAVGYEAYDEEEDVAVTLSSITNTTTAVTAAVTTDWVGDTYWLPEVKRFVIPAEGYNHMAIHVRISTDDATNVAYCKIYGTLDPSALDSDDILWVDLSTDIFGGATLSATNGSTEGIYFVDTDRPMLKYMIKIVAEVISGGGAAAASNNFKVFIKKSS